MGVLDNTTVTVDAILTKKGRELLAKGEGEFLITKFALSDDEIDYNLYDVTHPNGSNFYGQAIENMNLLEPVPSGIYSLRYKLGEGGTTPGSSGDTNAVVTIAPSSLSITNNIATGVFTPSVTNGDGNYNWTFDVSGAGSTSDNYNRYLSITQNSSTGAVTVTRNTLPSSVKRYVITITENNSGASGTGDITVAASGIVA